MTALLKVRVNNGIPVLLKINEAPFNEGCPITLLSEYQVRDHGFILDSVATKHKKGPGQWGTQRLELNDVVHLPFQDLGALMGFEILEITEEDLKAMDPLNPGIDVFEITSPKKWIPKRFWNVNMSSEDNEKPKEPCSEHLEAPFCPNDFIFM